MTTTLPEAADPQVSREAPAESADLAALLRRVRSSPMKSHCVTEGADPALLERGPYPWQRDGVSGLLYQFLHAIFRWR